MKKIFCSLFLTAIAGAALAQPPAGDAKPGDSYGRSISTTNAIDISLMPARLAQTDSINTTIRAKVLDVCPKKGCWLRLAVNDSTEAFVKMKDYAFFLPAAAKGKTILLEGDVKLVMTSVDELRHYAKDAKKPQAEIDAIVAPKKEIRVLASGIRIVE